MMKLMNMMTMSTVRTMYKNREQEVYNMVYNNVELDESILDIESWLPQDVFKILAEIINESESEIKKS